MVQVFSTPSKKTNWKNEGTEQKVCDVTAGMNVWRFAFDGAFAWRVIIMCHGDLTSKSAPWHVIPSFFFFLLLS